MLLLLLACTDPKPSAGADTSADAGADTSSGADSGTDTRPFTMGFTDWPYAATLAAVEDTRAKAQAHGDVVGLWFDNGVPWQASLEGRWPASVDRAVTDRLAAFGEDDARLISLGFLNTGRSTLATDWEGAARTGAWADADFNDPDVVTAYTRWALHVVELTHPTYLNLAIELGELTHNAPERWDAALAGYCAVYTAVKAAQPDLPVFASVVLHHPDFDEARAMDSRIPGLAPCTDLAAVSTYPYVFYGHANAGDPDTLPDDWLSQIDRWLPGKPFAVAETGWIAEDLVIDTWGIDTPATEDDQDRYVARLLQEASDRSARFVLWFAVVDFDPLWSDTLGQDDISRIWRDTGLYAGPLDGADPAPRPALATWEAWRARTVEP